MEIPLGTSNYVLDELITEAVTQDNCNNKCIDIAKCIETRKSELIKLVEKLQPALTDKDPTRRERGTHVLADVLGNLPHDFLKESELIIIANFFCDRLKDHAVVIPNALQGILAMVQMKNLPKDAPAIVVRMMFQHIQCQTLKQEERNLIYKVFQVIIHRYSEELKQFGSEFVMGFITMIDGERDPRNLLLIFGMLPYFLRTFPLGPLTEEMFEVMACYFPVDFYSDPNDPNKITRETLAAALQPCLIAVPDFAEFCMPLLLEKLDSQLHVAKLDSLRMLQCSCRTFTLEGIEKFLDNLYQSLNRELIPGTDKEVCKEALTALKELVHMLSSVPVDKDQAQRLHTMLEKVIKDGIKFLNDVEFSSFLPAARMLVAVAEASPAACQAVITEVVSVLVSQFHKDSINSEGKVMLLQTLSTFVAVCEKLHVTFIGNSEFSSLWTDITNIYMAGAQHEAPEVQKEGIHGFLISVKSVHSEIRPIIYDLLCKFVKHEHSAEIRQEVITCLKEYSRIYPEEIMENVVFSKLRCSQVSESGDAGDSTIHYRCMDALCEIAVVEPFTTCIVPQILDFFTHEPSTEKCVTGIKCLRKLVEMPDAGPTVHKYLYVQCAAVTRLLSWWLLGLCENTHPHIFHNENLLIDSAKVVSTILRTQSKSVQFDVVMEFAPRFLVGGVSFSPLDTTAPWHQTQAVLLLEAVLSPIQQDINIPWLSELIMKLVTISTCTSHPLTSKCAARLIACLINKAEDTESLSNLLSDLMLLLLTTPDRPDAPINEALNAVALFSWITKALVMRTHKDMDVWTQNLIKLLNHKSVGSKAADGFRLIMVQDEEYINEHNYCNIRLLYRQRFFQVVPKLIEAHHMADDDVKINYLSALAFLLQGAPKIVLSTSLPEMIPLLVDSLEQTDVVLLLTCLDTIIDLLEFKQQVLEDHINTFLPRFLQLSRFKDSMMVRIKALQCISQVCNFPTHILLPFKHQTIRELGVCLGDPKRLVRRQAVISRSRWFLFGAPGDPHNS